MELKFRQSGLVDFLVHRSNRTFMELKFNGEYGPTTFRPVLIVPLWN